MSSTQQPEQQYVGVEWRLDVPLGCRSVPKPTVAAPPQFVIALDTIPVCVSSGDNVTTITTGGGDADATTTINNSNNSTGGEKRDVPVARQFFSCDYETTVNISKALEEACGSLWSTQYRRVNKMVK